MRWDECEAANGAEEKSEGYKASARFISDAYALCKGMQNRSPIPCLMM